MHGVWDLKWILILRNHNFCESPKRQFKDGENVHTKPIRSLRSLKMYEKGGIQAFRWQYLYYHLGDLSLYTYSTEYGVHTRLYDSALSPNKTPNWVLKLTRLYILCSKTEAYSEATLYKYEIPKILFPRCCILCGVRVPSFLLLDN